MRLTSHRRPWIPATTAATAVALALLGCTNSSALSATTTDVPSPTPALVSPAAGTESAATPAPSGTKTADPAAAPIEPATPATEFVYVLGDSLTYKARKLLPDGLAAHGWVATDVSARNGRMVNEGLSILAEQPDLPQTVLIALGTNNWLDSADQASSWIAQARAIIGPDRDLIWVNVQMDGERYVTYTTVNAGLVAGARKDNRAQRKSGATGRTYIADWASYAADNNIRHSRDGVHYKRGAYRKRMDFYGLVLSQAPAAETYLLVR